MWSGIKIKYENQSVDDEELTNELASNSDVAIDEL
jgi:hypothetical protein